MKETIAQKCRKAQVSVPTYYARIKSGMTPEQALSKPSAESKRRVHRPIDEVPDEIKNLSDNFKRQRRLAKIKMAQMLAKKKTEVSKHQLEPVKPQPAQIKMTTPVKRPLYGPVSLSADAIAAHSFDRACGGYTAVILNHAKNGEFKYQIIGTNDKGKQYTNDVVKFINTIIRICDPEGKTPLRVIER